MSHETKLLVIVCAHNEERYILKCLTSLLVQTVPPSKIVVVNDSSTDNTEQIVNLLSIQYPNLIKIVNRKRNTVHEHGVEIPKTFNFGLRSVRIGDYAYLAKIDADIFLFRDYFERILSKFKDDSSIGIIGGKIINENAKSICGANMVIRMNCWLEISDCGFMPVLDAEDTFLIFKAKMRNWKTIFLNNAKSVTLRPFDSLPIKKILKQRIRIGRTTYRFGYHPLYFLGYLVKTSLTEKPYVLCIPLALYGWIVSWIYNDRLDESFRNSLRNMQKQKITCFLKL